MSKIKKARANPAPWTGEMPTPERAKKAEDHLDTFKTDTGRQIVRISVVDWLYTHDRISGDAYSAAYRLLGDWHFGGMSQRVTADMSRDIVDNGGRSDAFDVRRMTAAKHYIEAIAAVGPVHSHPVHEMVEGDTSPVIYGQKFLKWKDRAEASAAAKQRLADALERLAIHYAPQQENHVRKSRSFLIPEAKPAISG